MTVDDHRAAPIEIGAGIPVQYREWDIDSACSIRGIEVRLDWWLDSLSETNSIEVEISWDGGTSWTTAKSDAVESSTEHAVTLGSSLDRWDHNWTISELDNANLRVRVTSVSTSG